jgi:hypothetical protein
MTTYPLLPFNTTHFTSLGAYDIFHDRDDMFAFLHFAFVIHDTNPLYSVIFLVFITPAKALLKLNTIISL